MAGERAWFLARLAEKPDVTLRGLVAELAERGIKVSYFAVWHFFEGISLGLSACGSIAVSGDRAAGGAGPAGRHRADLPPRA
jgi:hypothetical protein